MQPLDAVEYGVIDKVKTGNISYQSGRILRAAMRAYKKPWE
jgi:hypothetical protein